jgi:hypothetical protein
LVVTDGVVVVAVETLLLELLTLTAAFSGRNRRPRFRLAISRPPLPR